MTADDTPAVPDTEAVREAAVLDYFAPDDPTEEPILPAAVAFRAGLRAALARDVPAGRDLTAQDVRRAPAEHGAAGVADYLNRIARPARDVPAPGDEPISGSGCHQLPVGSVVRWHRDRTDHGLRMRTPTEGWVPAISGGNTPQYLVVFDPSAAVSDRAGTAPTDGTALPATLGSVDDVAAVCLTHGLTETSGKRWQRIWDGPHVRVVTLGVGIAHVRVSRKDGAKTAPVADIYAGDSAVLVAAIEAARGAS